MRNEQENRQTLIAQEKLISIRMSMRITQEEMAKEINVDLRTYINKEKGVTQFKANEMFTIARRLGKNLDEIFIPTNFIKHEVS